MSYRDKQYIEIKTYKNSIRHRLLEMVKNKYLFHGSQIYDGLAPIYYITDILIPDFDDGLDSFSLLGYRFWINLQPEESWGIVKTDNLNDYSLDIDTILSACEITEQKIVDQLDVQFSKILLDN